MSPSAVSTTAAGRPSLSGELLLPRVPMPSLDSAGDLRRLADWSGVWGRPGRASRAGRPARRQRAVGRTGLQRPLRAAVPARASSPRSWAPRRCTWSQGAVRRVWQLVSAPGSSATELRHRPPRASPIAAATKEIDRRRRHNGSEEDDNRALDSWDDCGRLLAASVQSGADSGPSRAPVSCGTGEREGGVNWVSRTVASRTPLSPPFSMTGANESSLSPYVSNNLALVSLV